MRSSSLLLLVLSAPLVAADYEHDIKPILATSCIECHGAKKQKGKLRLDTPEAIMKGGATGSAVIAGAPEKSPLFIRISLPAGDSDIMPAQGDPLSSTQQQLISAWIKAGAPGVADGGGTRAVASAASASADDPTMAASATPATTATPATAAPAKPAAATSSSASLPGPQAKGEVKTIPPPDTDLDQLANGLKPADTHALEGLKAAGVWWRAVSKNGALIELDLRQLSGPLTAEQLKPLDQLADNVLWLDCAGSGITDHDLTHLRSLKRLQRLHLERTGVTDKGLAELAGLGELRYLNLVGTKVTDSGIQQLAKLAKLGALYLRDTKCTPAAAADLGKAIPGLVVEFDEELPDPVTGDDGGGKKRGKKK
jgi:hypothetical protein